MEKIQNSYETVLVISLKLGDEGVAAMVQKFKDLIEANATLESVDEWGKRRLAYLINKEAEAYYVLSSRRNWIVFTRSPMVSFVLLSLRRKLKRRPMKCSTPRF